MKNVKANVTGLKTTFVWTGIQVFIKILSGLVMGKVVAVTVGPSGLALIGQFQNFYGVCTSIASASIGSGVVKYTAEYKFQTEKQKSIWVNSLCIHAIMTLLVLFVVVLFSNRISVFFFDSNISSSVLVLFSVVLFFSVLNMLFLSILNGMGNHRLFSILNVFSSVYVLVIVVVGCVYFGIDGVIGGFIISQSSVSLFTAFALLKEFGCSFFSLDLKLFEVEKIKNLLLYGVASFVSGMSLSIMLLLVRNIIINDSSLVMAGYWEALWRFSIYFTMIGALPASIYYLPKYSAMKSELDIKRSFWESVRFIIPLMVVVGIIVLLFREVIIKLIFSKEFMIIAPILPILFIGNIVKVLNNLITNIMYAKKIMKRLMLSELLTNSVVVILSFYLFPMYGLYGVVYSYLLAALFEFLYFSYFFYNLRKDLHE